MSEFDGIWRPEQVLLGGKWQLVRRYVGGAVNFRETAKDATKKVREFSTQSAAQTACDSLNP